MSGSNVLISGFTLYNGDDAIVVSPPSFNVTVRNVEAHGTHGLSVSCTSGSGGNYTFEDSVVYDSLIGCRFKGKGGKSCNLTDVHWRNITMHNVSYPIHFIEDYVDPEAGGIPSDDELYAYTKNFTWENIYGDIAATIGDGSCVSDPCWYHTEGWFAGFLIISIETNERPGESPEKGTYLLCEDADHCRDVVFSNIQLRTAVSTGILSIS